MFFIFMIKKLHIYISHQKHNRPVLMSEKHQPLEIENNHIIGLYVVLSSLQVAYPFED